VGRLEENKGFHVLARASPGSSRALAWALIDPDPASRLGISPAASVSASA
jgi:hypothetical protein